MSICGSSAPDMSGANAAALQSSQISKDALDFYKSVYADQKPLQEQSAATANKVSNAQLGLMEQQAAQSKDQYDNYKINFQPVENSLAKDAMEYGSSARMQKNVDAATADVNAGFSNAEAQQGRNLSRMGVNPASGRSMGATTMTGIAKAEALAGASNNSRLQTEATANALKTNVASIGRNMPANATTSAGAAGGLGSQAVGAGTVPLNNSIAGANMMGQGFGIANTASGTAGSIYTGIGGVQNQANANDNMWMSALGAGIGAWKSDEKEKEDITPVDGEEALKAVEMTPVSKWKYKDGVADGGEHIGPMAQHVRKNMGDKAAPGGKVIDPISMNGINMAAIAALSKKVDHLSKQVSRRAA